MAFGAVSQQTQHVQNVKIARLREKYAAYLFKIYEKLNDKVHTAALISQMEADGFKYDVSEIDYIQYNWMPPDGSLREFVYDSVPLSTDCFPA